MFNKTILIYALGAWFLIAPQYAKADGLYFSSSGLVVSMEDDSLGTRDTGYPRPNKKWGSNTAHKNQYIIPSIERMLQGKNRVVKKGDTGFGTTIAVGKKFWKGFRGEIEVGYRQGGFEDLGILSLKEQLKDGWFMADHDGQGHKSNWAPPGTLLGTSWADDAGWAKKGIPIAISDGGFQTRSLLANLIYDIPTNGDFFPYVGAGVGMHWTTLNTHDLNFGGSGLAYQLMAGLNYKATDQIELFGGYRYFSADAVPIWDQLMVEVDTHDIEFGIRYYLESSKNKSKDVSPSPPLGNPFYVGISGGLIQQQDTGLYGDDVNFFNGIDVRNHRWEAGYGLEAVMGYRVCSWCRVELEYSYKFSTIGSQSVKRPPGGVEVSYAPEEGHSSGNISDRSVIHALLINFYADLNIAKIKENYGVLPFVGLGVGGMYMDMQQPRSDDLGWASAAMEKSAYAIQFAGGVGYSLTDQITIGTQYKYLTTLGNDENFADINRGVPTDMENGNASYRVNNIGIHSAGLFARYNFGGDISKRKKIPGLVRPQSTPTPKKGFYFAGSGFLSLMGEKETDQDDNGDVNYDFVDTLDGSYTDSYSHTYSGRRLTLAEMENGFGVVAAIGKDFGGWRAEIEYGFKENSIEKMGTQQSQSLDEDYPHIVLDSSWEGAAHSDFNVVKGPNNLAPEDIEGSLKIHTLMVNAYKDFHHKGESIFTPYAGFGLGIAWQRYRQDNPHRTTTETLEYYGRFENTVKIASDLKEQYSEDKTAFAAQIMLGITTDLTEKISLVTGYRMFGTSEDVLTHNFEAGARYNF